jgi:DNA anti-recombination protein RmuC
VSTHEVTTLDEPGTDERDRREDVVAEMSDLLEDVRADLVDGADLALAAQLIGDVLHRRIRRIHRSLRALERRADELDAGEDHPLRERIASMRARTHRFEAETQALAKQLDQGATAFEHELGEMTDGLGDLLG